MNFPVKRKVNLKTIVEKYRNTNLLSGESPHNSILISAVEEAKARGEELWIEDRGCSLDSWMPAFYEVTLETNKKKERPPFKRNEYPHVTMAGKQMSCHSLSALAFVKNPDPNRCLSPDHICNPDDIRVLHDTAMLYDTLKSHGKETGTRQHYDPDKINWSPDNLQWITREENSSKAHSKESKERHQRFVSLIENCENNIRKNITLTEPEIENLKDIVGHGKWFEKKVKEDLDEAKEGWYGSYENSVIHEDEILACLKMGEREYVEMCLIENDNLYRSQIELVEDKVEPNSITTDENVIPFAQKMIPVLDFIEKYVTRCHMKDWDDPMWKKVIQWIKWANHHGHDEEPELKIVGHNILGSLGEWSWYDNKRQKKEFLRKPYIFETLDLFCLGLHYNEDIKKQILFRDEKENFKLVA